MNEESIGIYKIESPNGSCYIGMTRDSFKNRWKTHIKKLNSGNHHCLGLMRAYQKYGIDNLNFSILEIMDGKNKEEILIREKYWWNYYNSLNVNLYNGEPSGFGAVLHTEETKDKIRKSILENVSSKENSRMNRPCRMCGHKKGRDSLRSFYCSKCREIYLSSRKSKMRNEYDLVKELYLEKKMTTREIGEIFGISQQSSYRILQDMGLLVPKHKDYKGPVK